MISNSVIIALIVLSGITLFVAIAAIAYNIRVSEKQGAHDQQSEGRPKR